MPSKVEKALTYLENRLTRASDNLMELAQLDTYKRLTGENGFPPVVLQGETGIKLEPTLRLTKLLWHQLHLIINQIDKVKRLIGNSQFISVEDAGLIDDLLNGKTIDPNLEPVLGDDLTIEQPTELMTAKEVLDRMSENYESAKKSIMAVDALWNYLPIALKKCEEDVQDLLQLVAALDEEPPELTEIPVKLLKLRTQVEADPFGVKETVDREVTPQLARSRKELADLELQRHQVRTELKKAHHKFDQLKDTRIRAEMAHIKSIDKISMPHGLKDPLPAEAVEDLEAWLATLQSTLESGRWKAASIGLQRFIMATEDHLHEELKILAANETPLVVLAELRGRLSALQSKADQLQKDGTALPSELQEASCDAEKILYSKPCPLELGEELVTRYGTILNSTNKNHSDSTSSL